MKNVSLTEYVDDLKPEFYERNIYNMNFERECQFALDSLKKNAFLARVARSNLDSLKSAIMNIAATGLTLNPAEQYAFLVPRKFKIGYDQVDFVCLDISYRGLVKAATDTGSVLYVKADIVYEKDTFEIGEIGKAPVHKHNPFAKGRGEIVGAYCVAKTAHGDYLTDVMSAEELYKIRDKSESWKNEKARVYSPWFNFETEMMKKTVIKRASKLWPKTKLSEKLHSAIDIVNEHEGIDFTPEKSLQEEALEEGHIPPEQRQAGPEYLVLKGKLADGQLKDYELAEVDEEIARIKKRIDAGDNRYKSRMWIETLEMMEDYSANYKTYQDILNE